MTKDNRISIKQYEQAADEKVSLEGIKWLRKWDVCVQCDSEEEAEALRARLAQPEPTNRFNPDWDALPVMIEEQQRMAKRIEELETQLGKAMWGYGEWRRKAEALEQEKQEPVCVAFIRTYLGKDKDGIEIWKDEPVYAAPPQREWVGLTDDEIADCVSGIFAERNYWVKFTRAIEAKLKEKNT